MIKKLIREVIGKFRQSNWKREYDEIRWISTEDQLTIFQKKYLQKLLLHACNNVPYYNRIFNDIGLIEHEKVHLSKFNEIPILTKAILRERREELKSQDYSSRKWYYNTTGGSTGHPTKFIQDDVYGKWRSATLYFWHRNIVGIDEPNVRKVFLWGSERDLFQGDIGWNVKLNHWLTDTIFLNSFRMTEGDMKRYVEEINSYRPDLIRGYADSLYDLSRYVEKTNMKIHTPKVIVSSAEVLSNKAREKIENIFGTKVYDFYGSRETSNLAGECREGLMHIIGFHNYIEILDQNNQPVNEGEEGKVIVTNLHNLSMPFVRYDIGDTAVLGPKKCRCGNVLPTLMSVTGRTTDHFVKDDGTIISGHTISHIFGKRNWVKAFQIIQEDYNCIRLLVVPDGEVAKYDQNEIEQKMKLLMGDDCIVLWNFVDEIPKTPQGKHLYIKCLVSNNAETVRE